MKFNEILEEIKSDNQHPTEIKAEEVIKEDNKITWRFITPLGDKIECVFSSPKREKYYITWQTVWKTIIQGNYTVFKESKTIAFPTQIYWNIYKKTLHGKEFMEQTGCRFSFNSEKYSFPSAQDFYLNSEKYSKDNEEVLRGIYCIKENGLIIYIGSSATNIKQRWKDHVQAFLQKKQFTNQMYKNVKDPTALEFEILMTDEDIKKEFPYPVKYIDCFVIEYTENMFIKALRPKYNIEGKTEKFNYKNKDYTTAFNVDYIALLEECLLNDNGISPEGEEIIKDSVNEIPITVPMRRAKYMMIDERMRGIK